MRYSKLFLYVSALVMLISCETDVATSADGGTGQGGSMTRFAIQGNRMYVAGHSTLKVFDITHDHFTQLNEVGVDFGLETIFAKGEYLYLGANDAMYIFSISNPDSPSFIFRYSHIVSCDPVVVQGNRAYVTMRGGTRCNAGSNALEIIDIEDPNDPKLVQNYPMDSPHGLAVDGDLLFICEGEAGLMVERIGFLSDGRAIEFSQSFYRGDTYDFVAELSPAT